MGTFPLSADGAASAAPARPVPAPMVRVWDPMVRITHWTIAAAFLIAWLSAEEVMGVHEAAGLTIIAVVGLRALWGLIGPQHARFDDFVPTPAGLLAYARQLLTGKATRHLGHNPAGGAMAVALWASLLGTAALGLITRYPTDALRPFKHALEEGHEVMANATLALVALHLAGVLLSSLMHRENLPRSMVTGMKRVD